MPRPHTPRPSRTQPQIDLEMLESRRLMASFKRIPIPTQIFIESEGSTVSQFSDSAKVTLKRIDNVKGSVQVEVSTAPPQGAPPPNLVPSLGSLHPVSVQASPLPLAVAGQQYTSIHEVITFAEGEEAKTVTIPLIAGATGLGDRALPIYVTPISPGVVGTSATLKLVDRLDVTPPSIVGARLVSQRGGLRGIELTFSEPMDPASVQNPTSYAVSENTYRPNSLDVAGFVLTGSVGSHPSAKVKITSATYDPVAQTVTLTTERPLKASAQYTVMRPASRFSGRGRSATLIEAPKLTDVSGNPINGDGLAAGIFIASINGSRKGASTPRGPKASRS